MKNRVSAVILAGGQSCRFDYDDKGLLEWQGIALIRHVISSLEQQTDQIIINCNQNTAAYKGFGYPICSDNLEGFQGPMAGIQAALPLAKHDFVLVSPCDTPLLPQNLVERLMAPLLEQNADISYPECEGRQHYLPVLLKSQLISSINQYLAGEDRSMKGWYRTLNAVAVPFSGPANAFSNFNSRKDLLN